MMIEISPGEFWDRVSILKVKEAQGHDSNAELIGLALAAVTNCASTNKPAQYEKLHAANGVNYEATELIAERLNRGDTTSEEFQNAVRDAFQANAERARLKAEINRDLAWTGPQETKSRPIKKLAQLI